MAIRRLGVAFLIFVGWVAVMAIGSVLARHHGQVPQAVMLRAGVQLPLVLAPAWLLANTVWLKWPGAGLRAPRPRRSLVLLWFPGLLIALGLGAAVAIGPPPWPIAVIILINTALAGLSEELMFRGVLFEALLAVCPIRTAALSSAALFGALHAFNAIGTGNLPIALGQAVAATMIGVMLAGLRVRTGSLWPVIVVHALWDFAVGLLSSSGQFIHFTPPTHFSAPTLFGGFVVVSPTLIYGIFLLWRIPTDQPREPIDRSPPGPGEDLPAAEPA